MPTSIDLTEVGLVPDWPAPARVRCVSTLRAGGAGQGAGVSRGVYARLNLGDHVGDDPAAVADNRAWLADRIGGAPCWLRQVHGARIVDAAQCLEMPAPEADGAFTRERGVICAVMTADCLPVLLCDTAGSVVAAVHAGWRGLLGGALEAAVAAMEVSGEHLMAWLGPAIGPRAFEVGADVRAAFVAEDAAAASAFRHEEMAEAAETAKRAEGAGSGEVRTSPGAPGRRETCVAGAVGDAPRPKYLADIYALARLRLARAGVRRVFGGQWCTVSDAGRFFSYRRDGTTGRMATLIWLASE